MSNNEYYNQKKKQYDAQKKAVLALIKVLKGCETCGYKGHPQALTFDHIDPSTKSFSIANYGTRSWKALLDEIEKCRVLCANCHNIHTSTQVDNGVLTTAITDKITQLINEYYPGLIQQNLIPSWK